MQTPFQIVYLLCAAAVLASAYDAQDVRHRMDISYTNGSFRTIFSENSKLENIPVTEVCHRGVWIIGSDPAYWSRYTTIFPIVEEGCDVPVGPFVSARSAGVNSDNRRPSATFFTGEAMTGGAQVTENGIASLEFPVYSLVTINTNVEFFQEENFEGESFCFRPSHPSSCQNNVCWVFRWEYESELPWDVVSLAKSAKIGCTPSKQNTLSHIENMLYNPGATINWMNV